MPNIVKKIDSFLLENENAIRLLCKKSNLNDFDNVLHTSLSSVCEEYYKKHGDLYKIDQILFYSAAEVIRNNAIKKETKHPTYICPCCLFKGKETIINIKYNYLTCKECSCLYEQCNDASKLMYGAFKYHSKSGWKCPDCFRFIPSVSKENITCPYTDCCFVGNVSLLRKMNHPTIIGNINKFKFIDPDIQIISKLTPIKSAIDYLSNNIRYNCYDCTFVHNSSVIKAFDNLLKKYPNEMSNYLLDNSRSGGFQSRIFQEYINVLESNIPFSYKKGSLIYTVNSLAESGVFDGISEFNAIVDDKLIIKNNTSEFYIGGRKASYAKPYYIGKVLNIVDDNGNQLTHNILKYNFQKIYMRDVDPLTKVRISHLRITPHYQMGGMVYVNRIRSKIVKMIGTKS